MHQKWTKGNINPLVYRSTFIRTGLLAGTYMSRLSQSGYGMWTPRLCTMKTSTVDTWHSTHHCVILIVWCSDMLWKCPNYGYVQLRHKEIRTEFVFHCLPAVVMFRMPSGNVCTCKPHRFYILDVWAIHRYKNKCCVTPYYTSQFLLFAYLVPVYPIFFKYTFQ
jgi:hypothetical protein